MRFEQRRVFSRPLRISVVALGLTVLLALPTGATANAGATDPGALTQAKGGTPTLTAVTTTTPTEAEAEAVATTTPTTPPAPAPGTPTPTPPEAGDGAERSAGVDSWVNNPQYPVQWPFA